jgi:hypothetical protein
MVVGAAPHPTGVPEISFSVDTACKSFDEGDPLSFRDSGIVGVFVTSYFRGHEANPAIIFV